MIKNYDKREVTTKRSYLMLWRITAQELRHAEPSRNDAVKMIRGIVNNRQHRSLRQAWFNVVHHAAVSGRETYSQTNAMGALNRMVRYFTEADDCKFLSTF